MIKIMITKLKTILSLFMIMAMVSAIFTSCDDEDYTGYSTISPASTTISVSTVGGWTSPVTLTEAKVKYQFTVNLSSAQIVDVKIPVSKIDGTASDADVTFSNSVTIPAGATSAIGVIEFAADDLAEDAETLKLQVGDETVSNADFTPEIFEFNILNATATDLVIDLDWSPSTTTTDNSGNEIDPTDLADLRLLVTDDPYTNVIDGADGGSFETYTLAGDFADGTYLVVADFYTAMSSPTRNLDLDVTFSQGGILEPKTYAFSGALNTGSTCPDSYFILARIIKSGTSYTIEELGEKPPATPLVGDWNGIDVDDESGYHDYPSIVSTQVVDGELTIMGIGFGWMTQFWGEVIIDSTFAVVQVNWCDNTVTIPRQKYLTTTYKDEVQDDYYIYGSGTFDLSGTYPVLTISYELENNGTGWADWCYANEYLSTTTFIANLTLDPAGLKEGKIKVLKFNHSELKPKN